jgi:hypothetical protein
MATIAEIYDRYEVPEHLRLHMLRVAALGCVIDDNWSGPALRRAELRRVLLIHDIGNVVKMPRESSDTEQRRALIQKYGNDDHAASYAIAREVDLTKSELALMDAKVFVRNDETLKSNDYTLKVAAYADQRVAPQGVMSLIKRLREAQDRYRDKPGSSMNNPRTPELIDCAIQIETQLAPYLRIAPDAIDNQTVSPYIERLLKTRIA